eukprot:TRINITY_DN930_c0_g1_i4.p1 TRINITY_DN930_c0_g1~~TRINITY_DN930_c0_g1_i4.p1  ORF type:complete len:294 (+),score=44.09 TRINITY_DN930_c0_g1_i4:167-1048(+)
MDAKPPLKVQTKLRESNLEAVVRKYRLLSKVHSKHSNLVLLKYDQGRSPFRKRVVQECRGIILDSEANWEVVAWPYLKFFNYGEKYVHALDWTSAKVYEKLDGSLATLYWYKGEWHVSSSGVPDASKGLTADGSTFAELFWGIWNSLDMRLPTETHMCYMFEMLSKRNVIVVHPKKEEIVLHGVRNLETLQELDPAPISQKYAWPCAKTFDLKTLPDILLASKNLDPTEAEGFVVQDQNFNRVKVKTPQYVALVNLSVYGDQGINLGHMLRIVRASEGILFFFLSLFSLFVLT